MATYLATVQIGRYADWQPPGTPDTGVPLRIVGPGRPRPGRVRGGVRAGSPR